MKPKRLPVLALGVILGGTCVPLHPLHAQESAAGREIHQSGTDAVTAADSAGESVKHAYRATVDKIDDAALTTNVKTKLLKDPITRHYTIQVHSDQGQVTLQGSVDSPATAARAQSLASNVNGVSSIKNELTWPTSER